MPAMLAAAASALASAGTAIAASAGTAAATSTLAATAVSVGKSILLNLAISSAMSLLNPQVGQAGRPIDITLDPDGPIPFAAGRVGAAGAWVHKTTFGPDLMYYGWVCVLSGAGPIKSFVQFKADEEVVTFDGNGKAITSQWANEMWMRLHHGAQPSPTAMTSPPGLKNGATLPAWGVNHRLNGKAAYMKVMGENSKRSAYPNGETKPLWTIEGLYGWDPRQDSTYPGGSGPCRLNDPSTWVYIERGPLWGLKWALGLWEGPTGKGAPQVDYQVGGIGAKLEGIDVAAFVNAQNINEAYDWKVAAYPTTDDNKAQVLDGFLQASGCIYAQKAGKISCIQRAAPRTSIVTISAADTAGPIRFATAASRINRINTLRPSFWSEANRWQMTPIEEVSADAYRTEDGAIRPRPVAFPYVPSATQAAQLAALQIANTREGIAGTIPLKPHLQRITPGDAFTITEPGFILNGLKCLCLSTDYDPATGIHNVTFVSETDAKYPFALGQSPDAPESPTITPVDPTTVTPPLPGDWTIVVRPPTGGGGQVPGFDLTGVVSNDTATAVLVEWGLTNDPTDAGDWTTAYQGPPTATSIPIDGLQPGQTYYIAVSYQRGQNYSTRQVYGPYVAPDLVADDVSPSSPTIVVERERIDDLIDAYGDTIAAEASAAAAAASAAAADLAEERAIRASSDASYIDAHAVYRFANTADGWTASNLTLTPAPNGLTATATGGDQRLIRTGLSFPGSRFTRVVIDIERTANRTTGVWQGRLYYITSGHGYSDSFFKDIGYEIAVGERQELIFDMAALTVGGTDWLTSTITALRFDPDDGLSSAYKIRGIRIVGADTAAPAAAATASAGSAATALASETAAGLSASAADADRLDAQAAEAGAGIARDGAVAAQSGAAGSEAAALQSYLLSAQIGPNGGAYVNANPSFASPYIPTGSSFPPGYSDYVGGTMHAVVPGQVSDKAIEFTTVAGVDRGIRQTSTVAGQFKGAVGPGWWVIECIVKLVSGTLSGSGVRIQVLDAASGSLFTQNIGFATTPDTTGIAPGAGVAGKTYMFPVLVEFPANTDRLLIWNMASYGPMDSARPAKTIQFHLSGSPRRASASEIETGRARGTFPSVLARIQNEETTRASETAALADRATTTEALARLIPNLVPNPKAADGLRYWNNTASWTTITNRPDLGSYFFTSAAGNQQMWSDWFRLEPNAPYTMAFKGDGGSVPASVYLQVQTAQDSGGAPGAVNPALQGAVNAVGASWTTRKQGPTFTTTSATRWGRVVINKDAASSFAAISDVMVHAGAGPVGFNDQATEVAMAARTSITETSVADAQAKLAIARIVLIAEAEGGNPARFGLYSDSNGLSTAVFDASEIWLGPNTVFNVATTQWRTTFGTDRRVESTGAPFGGTDQLTEWKGLASVPFGSETKTNAKFYQSDVAPFFGGSAVAAGSATALLSSIGVNAAPSTTGASWVSWAAATFGEMPSGGRVRLYSSGGGPGLTTTDGNPFQGNWRARQNGVNLATGIFDAIPGEGFSIILPSAPLSPAAIGNTTISFDVQRRSGANDMTGGFEFTFYADWTKLG